MADYFTSEHFELLSRWKGKKREVADAEQDYAYDELKKAYELTEEWATALQKRSFPAGRVEIRKRPTNQGNKFPGYTWARIYPAPESPKKLAYTVGIDADLGFVVKIDTVGLGNADAVRQACLKLRGSYGASPIANNIPAAVGIALSLDKLVEWSANAINGFAMTYDEVASIVGVGIMDDTEILARFEKKSDFKEARARWSAAETHAFCQLAYAVHEAGLDWWHTDIKPAPQVRFGRKQPGQKRALAVLGYVHCGRATMFAVKPDVAGVTGRDWIKFTPQLVTELVDEISASQSAIDGWKPLSAERTGYWPDQLQSEQGHPSDVAGPDGLDPPAHGALAPRPVNRIYYGPPGTGKTRQLRELFETYVEKPADVDRATWDLQLVGRYGWRAAIAAAAGDLGRAVRVTELEAHPLLKLKTAQRKGTGNVRATLWGYLQAHTSPQSHTVEVTVRRPPYVFDKTTDSEWYVVSDWQELDPEAAELLTAWRGGPSSAQAPIHRYRVVTFHPSYSYEDFVIGLRPVIVDDASEGGSTGFRMVDGVFKQICSEARANPTKPYGLFIDEINRANIAKVFGELITLIEPDKRAIYAADGTLLDGMEVQLPGTGTENGEQELFGVPANLNIYGTMNTADRSIALLDIALRRRFEFQEVPPDYDAIDRAVEGVDLGMLLLAINDRLEFLADRDRRIGHAYFIRVHSLKDLQESFANQVIPLLQEYFFDDWGQVALVLTSRTGQSPFVKREALDGATLFGKTGDLAQSERHRYQITPPAEWTVEAFQSLYQITVEA